MPAISIKGTTGNVKSRREGGDIIVEKTIEKAVVTETHQGEGKRVKGKQKPRELITLSVADVKGFEKDTAEKIKEAVKDGKEATKKQLQLMNTQTNEYGEKLEKKHKAAVKKMTIKVKQLTKQLEGVKETGKVEEQKLKGEGDKAKAELRKLRKKRKKGKRGEIKSRRQTRIRRQKGRKGKRAWQDQRKQSETRAWQGQQKRKTRARRGRRETRARRGRRETRAWRDPRTKRTRRAPQRRK